MTQYSPSLLFLLDKLNALFYYPEDEKMIPDKIIWANDCKVKRKQPHKPVPLLESFNIPINLKAKLLKVELEDGIDHFQLLNAGLYELRKDGVIFDHHYFSGPFGNHYFIVATPEDFPSIYSRIKNPRAAEKKIKRLYIYGDGTRGYQMIVVGKNNEGRMTKSTCAKWAGALYEVGTKGEIPYSKSYANINNDHRLALYCGDSFTSTRVLGEKTMSDGTKYLFQGDVKINVVSDKEKFGVLKKKFHL